MPAALPSAYPCPIPTRALAESCGLHEIFSSKRRGMSRFNVCRKIPGLRRKQPPGATDPSNTAHHFDPTLYACPTFAPAYVGRKGWANPAIAVEPAESNRRKSFSSQVRFGEPGAPVQSWVEWSSVVEVFFRRRLNTYPAPRWRGTGLRVAAKLPLQELADRPRRCPWQLPA